MPPPRDWYRLARVRAGKPPSRVGGRDNAVAFFPPELQPHVDHPLVQRLGKSVVEELLRQALLRYLHATTVLEIGVVNEVAGQLMLGRLPLALSEQTIVEVSKLYCDEGYHALVASELISQLGDAKRARPPPAFLSRLNRLQERFSSSVPAELLRFLFTVVSETTVSTLMNTLARSEALAPAVREYVADHLEDERWHGTLFSTLFSTGWSQWSPAERERHGLLLPELVEAFLTPDLQQVASELIAVGLAPAEADRVVADAYPPSVVLSWIQQGARPVFGCLRRAGALNGALVSAFSDRGLEAGPA